MSTTSWSASSIGAKDLIITLFSGLVAFAVLAFFSLVGCSSPNVSDSAGSDVAAPVSDSSTAADASSEQNKGLPFESIPSEQIMGIEDIHSGLAEENGPFVLDIRSRSDYSEEHIDGSHGIPAGRQIDIRMNEIPRDKAVIIIGKGTDRLAEVRQTLIDAGYDPSSLFVVPNAMEDWAAAGYPTVEGKGYHC